MRSFVRSFAERNGAGLGADDVCKSDGTSEHHATCYYDSLSDCDNDVSLRLAFCAAEYEMNIIMNAFDLL